MTSRPHTRVSSSYPAHHGWHGKPMPSSWELHLLHVSELCPCAVNLGTAEFLSDRGRWGRWIRRRRMRAQPRPTTAHSPQYSTVHRVLISHYYYLRTAKDRCSSSWRAQLFFVRIRKSLVWLLRSPANRCNLSGGHNKGLLRRGEGRTRGTRIVCFLAQLKKEDKDMTAR